MKTKTLALLCAFAAVAVVLIGCNGKEKPYSIYQIEAYFPGGATIEAKPEAERTEQEKQDLLAMRAVLIYLIQNQYVKTIIYNQPIVFEGADEAYNDEQGERYYEGKKDALDQVDFAAIIEEAKDEPESELTGSGSFTFTYAMKKGSTASPMAGCSVSYGIIY